MLAALLIVGVAMNRGAGFKIRRTGGFTHPSHTRPPSDSGEGGTVRTWEKPEGFKIIGLIFFGRPSVVAILDCYLKKNLVTQGGWLDEVHFVVNTDKEEDIAYLDELIETEGLYQKIAISSLGYNEVWKEGVESENMYIKIDDDIVSATPTESDNGIALADRQCNRSFSTMKLSLTLCTQNLPTLARST